MLNPSPTAGKWERGRGKSKRNTGKSNSGYKYICKLKNSVSVEVSEPVGEVFGPEGVPKPTITSSCNANLTSCTLTCKSDTTDAEPVTYSWKVGEGAWEVVDKQLIVSNSDSGKPTNGYKYTCKLKNSVSGEVSEPVGEVFGSEAVPKPTITYSCNANKTSCILTCEGDTTDAEPVTYSWKMGEGAWEFLDKQRNVSKNDTGKSTNSYKFFCKMKNSAGEGEVSEPVELVFGSDGWLTKARLFGISVFVLAIAGVLSFIIGHRAKTGVWFYEKESMPWKGEFWKHQREVGPTTDTSNGVSASTEEALARKNYHKDDSVNNSVL
ncbi:cell adhesion molecule CEACAM5-like [Salvelinus alpinus]